MSEIDFNKANREWAELQVQTGIPETPPSSPERVPFVNDGTKPCSACGDGDTDKKYHVHVSGRGWLKPIVEAAQGDVETWPEWQRKGIQEAANASPEQDARAWTRVQQKDTNGCVVASLAMLTGEDYETVKSAFEGHDFSSAGVCSEWEGCNYLTMRGFAYQKVYKHDSLRKCDREEWPILWADSTLLVGYLAQVHLGQFVHAVVVGPNGVVLDPYREGEYHLSDYEKVNHLIAVFDIRESRMAAYAAHIRQQQKEQDARIAKTYADGGCSGDAIAAAITKGEEDGTEVPRTTTSTATTFGSLAPGE